MNYEQFGLFLVYLGALFTAGVAFYYFLNPRHEHFLNRSVYLGECLLLGGILVVGELLLLSFTRFYNAPFLWATVIANYAFLFSGHVRSQCFSLFAKKTHWDVPLVLFYLLTGFFIFRNLYFLVDVDSHSTYLFAQKLWLAKGTSLWADKGVDMRVFTPHFNAIPYALGISLFPKETLFPQLVVASWTVIVLFLVFGYTSWRFNRYYGVAACMLVLFNDHMYYSGANQCCIINSALVAFLFAASYNFWLAHRDRNMFRMVLALIFLSHLMANKYQMVYVTFLVLFLGLVIQPDLRQVVRSIMRNRCWLLAMIVAAVLASLWYVKNFIITGCPAFPILAGKFGVMGWTPEREAAFLKGCGHLSLLKLIKYSSYLFIWPGVQAAKWVFFVIFFLPVILLMNAVRSRFDDGIKEWVFWLGVSLLATIGICLTNYTDPRVYRYAIAVLAFTTVFSIDYILRYCFTIQNKIILASVVLFLALPQYGIMFDQGSTYKRPTFQDNFDVLLDRLHMSDVGPRYFPTNLIIDKEYAQHSDKTPLAAWLTGEGGKSAPGSAFLLPIRPQVDLWHTSIIRWDSYDFAPLMVKDLHDYGLQWLMEVKDGKLVFHPVEDYPAYSEIFERDPKQLFYNYGFPEELARVDR